MVIFLKWSILKITSILEIIFRVSFSPLLLREEIIQIYDSKIFALNKEQSTCEARKKYFERKKAENLDAVDSSEKNKKAKNKKFQSVEEKITQYLDPRNTKMIVEFNDGES